MTVERSGSLSLLHVHGFKCAGTTFTWVLERNFPGRVAYVEAGQRGARLPWERLSSAVDLDRCEALTSHLVTVPDEGEGPAVMTVSFVREPRARLRSAYEFQRRTGSLPNPAESWPEFVDRARRSILANYQTRLLSPQDHGGWERRKGWQLRPELIDLHRPDLFVGVVERFDESMVALEFRMERAGIAFDGSYPAAMNAAPSARGEDAGPGRHVPLELVELDEVLVDRASARLTGLIAEIPDFDVRLASFRRRCEEATALVDTVTVQPPEGWTYLEPAP